MDFQKTPLDGAYTIALDRRQDERGFFARAFCQQEFADHGLETTYVQANISQNKQAGLLRGMHFQRGKDAEVKLVRCIAGSVYDVIVDMREDSPSYRQWYGAELSAENGLLMYVPKGFAHGYQALTDDATVHYMVSAFYAPESEGGIRYNDPAIGIQWPLPVTGLSPKDEAWLLLDGDAK